MTAAQILTLGKGADALAGSRILAARIAKAS